MFVKKNNDRNIELIKKIVITLLELTETNNQYNQNKI